MDYFYDQILVFGLILYVIEMLFFGGDMFFVFMGVVYEMLFDKMCGFLDGLIVIYFLCYVFGVIILDSEVVKSGWLFNVEVVMQDVCYLVVVIYFLSGWCGLYVNLVFIIYIEGLSFVEFDVLLQMFYVYCMQFEF